MRFLGGARVRRVPLGRLERIGKRERFLWRVENLRVVGKGTGDLKDDTITAKIEGKSMWWRSRPVERFFVGKNTVRKDQAGWWEDVLGRIEKTSEERRIKRTR